MKMEFKSSRQEREWVSGKVHPVLIGIAGEAVAFADRLGWSPVVVTDIYRTLEEEAALRSSGVHHAWRAIDFRTRDIKPKQVEDLRRFLEGAWVYDPMRPSKILCYTAEHGSGPHMHVQVTDRTVRRGK